MQNQANSAYKLLHVLKIITDKHFMVRVGEEITKLHKIKVGVSQDSVLEPTLYFLYTISLPTTESTIIGTFADDTIVLAIHEDLFIASTLRQS